MPKRKETKLSQKEKLWECKYFTVYEQKKDVKSKVRSFFSVERPNGNTVHIIAITDADEVVLIKQFRPAVGCFVIELPAGICDKASESLHEVAQRELLEETGYTADDFDLIFSGTVSPGITNELYNLFLATPARRIKKGGGTSGEDIEVIVMPRRRLIEFLIETSLEGQILVDAKIPAALALAEKYLNPQSIF